MDFEIEKRLSNAIKELSSVSIEDFDFEDMDPIAKMMLVAVMNEWQKLCDDVAKTPEKVVERYCADFLPLEKLQAMPAITIVHPTFKEKNRQNVVMVESGTSFTYKKKEEKTQLNYLPLFKTMLLPCSEIFIVTSQGLRCEEGAFPIDMPSSNSMWIGLVTDVEIESLQGLSLLFRGTDGLLPEHVYVGSEHLEAGIRELEISTMREMENMSILEPFDAQQSSGKMFSYVNKWKESLSYVNKWKECILNLQEDRFNKESVGLLYVTDKIEDRDLFKPYAYPKEFQQWLENDALERFQPNTLWIQIVFPKGYFIPDAVQLDINVVPVVNVDVNSLVLTQSSPMAKLQKNENSFFLRVLETSTSSQHEGFDKQSDEIIIRDFDASCYHDGDLYRDIRNLYNRFMDDYYAFIESKGINDGSVLTRLRETINNLGKGVGEKNDNYRFDSGTYVMRNIGFENLSSTTKVSYITTQGEAGNIPKAGDVMEHRRLPGINQKVDVLIDAVGGADKVSPDAYKELLRYYALTNDRLYTRMDVDAFLRKEIMLTFGSEEYHRIFIRIRVEGAGGECKLQRGLYIDIEFKDSKNYEYARCIAFDNLMQQRITNLSCISMPIIVTLINLEG